ncbi:Hypothetical protein CINCED_3A001878 [Cinara cedri]|uniref:Uncharacterized protein n=1 Tax=Cinara cedri TaxID=506608 RepID=A0A5E4MCP3_9HEMI|nr:Hypothetical protein CINCED_3A001878 [Cinara cedri]
MEDGDWTAHVTAGLVDGRSGFVPGTYENSAPSGRRRSIAAETTSPPATRPPAGCGPGTGGCSQRPRVLGDCVAGVCWKSGPKERWICCV